MTVMGSSLVRATVLAAASAVGASLSAAQPPGSSTNPLSFRDIARQASPVVVSIVTRKRGRVWEDSGRALLDALRGDTADADRRLHDYAASGFIISASGEILTNHHVVDGAETIEVSLLGSDRVRYRARRVGTDPVTDSALLQIDHPPSDLPVARLGNSSALEPGDWVMAIGNPFQFAHSVTVGVVSFARRPFEVREGRWQDLIQTDASIAQGSSGGPLFNAHGEVVGMNVGMMDGGGGATMGIGFAVPIDSVKALLPQLRAGKVVRGQLGIGLHGGPILHDEATALRLPMAAGAIIRTVDRDSPAEHAGLQAGDVIVSMNGKAVVDTRDLIARTASAMPGTQVMVTVVRNGREQVRMVAIEAQPVDAVDVAVDNPPDDGDGMTLGEAAPAHDRVGPSAHGGAVVITVAPDSPAADAELAVGDIIREINGRRVNTLAEAQQALADIRQGLPVFLLVLRSGTGLFLEIRRH